MQNIIYVFVPSLCCVRKRLKSILCFIDFGLILSDIQFIHLIGELFKNLYDRQKFQFFDNLHGLLLLYL